MGSDWEAERGADAAVDAAGVLNGVQSSGTREVRTACSLARLEGN